MDLSTQLWHRSTFCCINRYLSNKGRQENELSPARHGIPGFNLQPAGASPHGMTCVWIRRQEAPRVGVQLLASCDVVLVN